MPSKQDRDHGTGKCGDEGLEQHRDDGGFDRPRHGKSAVWSATFPLPQVSRAIHINVVLGGDDEEQLLVPGLLVKGISGEPRADEF